MPLSNRFGGVIQPASRLVFKKNFALSDIEEVNTRLKENSDYELIVTTSISDLPLTMGCSDYLRRFAGRNFSLIGKLDIDGIGILNLLDIPNHLIHELYCLSFITIGNPRSAIPEAAKVLVPVLGCAIQQSFTLRKPHSGEIEQVAMRIDGTWMQTESEVVLRRSE